ncbi:MAG: EamA family transporter, partial [Actinomycetota bacterium]
SIWLGWGLAAVGMLLVSTDSFFIRLAATDSWTMAFLVAVISLPVFVGLWWREAPRSSGGEVTWRPLAAVGALGAVSHVAFITAVTRTDVANVVAIVAAAPVVAAGLAWFALGERVAARLWVAMAVTGLGIGVVVGGSVGRPRLDGDLLAVVAIVAFGAATVVWRRHPDLSRHQGLALSSALVAAATALPAAPLDQAPRTYVAAALMGLLFSPAGRIAHSSAPRFAPAAEVALFAPVETVAAPIWAWLAFEETPAALTVVGAVIIITGMLVGTAGSGVGRRRVQPARA